MATGKRKSERVGFAAGLRAQIVGIDGTWRRACVMHDISQSGARLQVDGQLSGLHLTEFFLLLSSSGLVYRRCRLVRLAGDQIGVEFIKPVTKSSKPAHPLRRSTDHAV